MRRDLPTKCLAEALGAFVLVFIVAGVAVADAAFDVGGLLAIHVVLPRMS